MSKALIFLSLILGRYATPANAQAAEYTGRMKFTMGRFGTFNHPQKGDSGIVFMKSEKLIFKMMMEAWLS